MIGASPQEAFIWIGPFSRGGSRLARRKIVLATGAFDLLHLGHVRFLQESKKRGGPKARLVVVVARDRTVLERKGQRPILPENQRRELVGSLRAVDKAILGHERLDMLGILKEVKPNIICTGYDQKEIKASLIKTMRDEKIMIPVVEIPRLGPNGLNSSTKVKARIARQWKTSRRQKTPVH
jgi:FAD synthetase